MKKYGLMLVALLVCGAAYAAATSTISIRQVRDPVQFKTIWDDSMAYLLASTNNHGAVTNATLANQTGAVTATAVVTPQAPSAVTPTITVTVQGTTGYDSTGAAITNAAGDTLVWITNVTAACSALPLFATNAAAAITVVGGDAVTTNTAITLQKVP